MTPQRCVLLVVFCLVWSLSRQVQDALTSWHEHLMEDWAIYGLGEEFLSMLLTMLAMGVLLVATINLAPPAGPRRLAALVGAVAVAGVLGSIMRCGYMNIIDPGAGIGTPRQWLMLWTRYGTFATLFTLVVEFRRRESRSLAAMHQAEVDRLALDREMAEARLQVLQAQIEPHFLFNTLANVRRLYAVDGAAGRAMMDNLMRYLAEALPRMRAERSSVASELALVEAYLEVQRVRMGHRLSYEIRVPSELRADPLPPMMLLTLVENAIKHGLNVLPEGGRIDIAVSARADGRLRVDVVDDGRGFQDISGTGTGVANIRARLAATWGDAAALTLAEHRPRGVIATLDLPRTPALAP